MKNLRAYIRKHVKYLKGLGKIENTTNENFNSVRFKYNFNPTVRNKHSSDHVKCVPEVYTVLKFLYRPWDIGEYCMKDSDHRSSLQTQRSTIVANHN